jgi:hypothetical protein
MQTVEVNVKTDSDMVSTYIPIPPSYSLQGKVAVMKTPT